MKENYLTPDNDDKEEEKYTFFKTIFSLKVGSMFFCKKKQKTIFDKYGTGVPLYFIFLKILITFFWIGSLASVYFILVNYNCKQSHFKCQILI